MMSALAPETSVFATGLPSADVSGGNFGLNPDQALIVQVPDVPSGYSGIELMNVFGAALPYTLAQTTLNNTTAFADPDGYTYYVVSATNPGVANWLDSNGVSSGEIFARFENLPDGTDPTGSPVTTEVVPVADVASYLPTDTPAVSHAEYAADMSQRVLSYDYALDLSRENAQPDWVLQEIAPSRFAGRAGQRQLRSGVRQRPDHPAGTEIHPGLHAGLGYRRPRLAHQPNRQYRGDRQQSALGGQRHQSAHRIGTGSDGAVVATPPATWIPSTTRFRTRTPESSPASSMPATIWQRRS